MSKKLLDEEKALELAKKLLANDKVIRDDLQEQLDKNIDELSANISGKVDKVDGKGLSTNDLTDELKQSYDNAVTDSHTHDNKSVLDDITNEKVLQWDKAEENIQADWEETDETSDDFIKNKPTIPDITGLATETYVDNKVADYTKTVDLADVATSGSYNDLADKPSINNVPLVGNLNTADLKLTDATLTEEGVPAEAKTVGTKLEEQSTSLTAVKEELTKKANVSDIPTKVSELQNDSNYQTDTDVTNTLTTYATKTYVGEQISSVNHLKREIVTEIPSPETADKNTIYMLKIESATGEDKYKEYLLIDGTLQCIGDTSVDLTDYAKKTEIPTELPANGGNSLTVNGHTVKSDVPENAVFTDTVYDDTEVKEEIDEINSNLTQLEVSDIAGGKNLLENTAKSKTVSGVTFTVNDDKSISCVGTSTNVISFDINKITLPNGTYVFNGSSAYIKNNDDTWYKTIMDGDTFTITEQHNIVQAIIYISPGDTVDKTIYAMIRKANITDDTYEPYIPSVKMLTKDIDSVKNDLGGLTFSASGTTLTITDGTNTWTLGANS